MTTKPPEAAPTEPSARQLAHEHEGSMCSEQAHSVDCDHWTRVVTARDRQHEADRAALEAELEVQKGFVAGCITKGAEELMYQASRANTAEAALAASRADAELWKTGRDVADAHRRELATDLDRARSRLRKAEGALKTLRDLRGLVITNSPFGGLVLDADRVHGIARRALTSPESAAPPKEPT